MAVSSIGCCLQESPELEIGFNSEAAAAIIDVENYSLSDSSIVREVVSWERSRVAKLLDKIVNSRADLGISLRELTDERSPVSVDIMDDLSESFTPANTPATDTQEVSLKMEGASNLALASVQQAPLEVQGDSVCLIQFGTFMYFCDENDAQISIDVKRMGNANGRAEVYFTTSDGTAKAGHKYVHMEGKLNYEPGERDQTIQIKIIKTQGWDGVLEFLVELLPEGLSGATLGRYLHRARVKVIDSTCWPTDKHKKLIDDGRISQIPKWSLLQEFWKLNLLNPVILDGTMKIMLAEQLHNLDSLLELVTNIYLIDHILDLDNSESNLISGARPTELLILVAAKIMAFAMLHYVDYIKLTWGVGGGSRMTLQKSVLRRYLNYTEDSRAILENGDIVMAITRDSARVVQEGYMGMMELSKNIGQLFMICIFLIASPVVFGQQQQAIFFAPLLIFPSVLLPFLMLRQNRAIRCDTQMDIKEDAIVDRVERTVANYRLIAEYNQRPEYVSWFEKVIKEFNGAAVASAKVQKNNEYFSTWITLLLLCSWILIGGWQLSEQGMSLGIFLSNLKVIQTIGAAYGSTYKILLKMQSCFGGLERLTLLLNKPIDGYQRLQLSRFQQTMTTRLRDEVLAANPGFNGFALDLLHIKVANLNISYPGSSRLPGLAMGEVLIRQGSLVSIIGPHGEGKSTLLKVLGGTILPQEESCFVPSHLRVLHVGTDALFCQGTLLKNLTFGCGEHDSGAAMDRVKRICSLLQLPSELIKIIDSDVVKPWPQVLSMTSRYLVSFARAFIFNPEVLCVHKPLLPFEEDGYENILSVFRQFVDQRGICLDDSTVHLRRPRTAILTSARMASVLAADDVYSVSAKEGMRRMEKKDVEASMVG